MLIEEFLSDNNIQGPLRSTERVSDACSMLGTALEEESVQENLAQYLEVGATRDGEWYVRWTYAEWVRDFIVYPGSVGEPSDNYISDTSLYENFIEGCYHNHYKRRAA